jgi:hypothetical protein
LTGLSSAGFAVFTSWTDQFYAASRSRTQSGAYPNPSTMITNPWINRIFALTTLLAIYAAGYAGGRDAAILAQQQQQHACHTK